MPPRAIPWKQWWPAAVVAVVTFIAFLPALHFGFVWDDENAFYENFHYRGVGWTQLKWMWTTYYLGAYRPLAWMTYAADDVVWGWRPERYHLSSVLLHVVNAVLVYFLARQVLKLARGRDALDAFEDLTLSVGAVAAALLFAIHPQRVEPVAWVSGRADELAGMFLLLTVLAYLRYGSGFAAVGLYLLSLFSKPVGLSLPAVLLVLDLYPLRRLSGAGQSTIRAGVELFAEKIPFFVLAGIGARVAFLSKADDTSPAAPFGLVDKGFQIVHAIGFYLWKMIVPFGLSPLYERSFQSSVMSAPFLLSAVVVVLLTCLLIANRKRWPSALAAWMCYLVFLIPTAGVVQFGWQMAADRYTYMASVPPALLAGGGLWWLALHQRFSTRRLVSVEAAAAVALVAGLGVLTWQQTGIWQSDQTLWGHAVSVNPRSVVAHNNFGRFLFHEGSLDEAEEHLQIALTIMPDYAEAHNNMGAILNRKGRIAEAIAHFRRAVELRPQYENARRSLDAALLAKPK